MKRSNVFGAMFLGFFDYLFGNSQSVFSHQVTPKPTKALKVSRGHNPHQGEKEKARRRRQMRRGQLVGIFEARRS